MTDVVMAPPDPRLRSGTAARLAGLPVTTLRVWERRYGVVAASRSQSGQRVYSPHDVARLRVLRQLTLAGHAIGTIAKLGLEALRALVSEMPALANPVSSGVLDAVVVGRSAAHLLEAVPGCALQAVHDDLAQAASAPLSGARADLLLVRLASLQPVAVDQVLALGARLRASAVMVVYGFGTEASEKALRDAGAMVSREPLTHRELARWVRGAREALPPALPWAGGQVEARRFSDDMLAELSARPSPVACECLRHMADIVAQLSAFERYSQDCTSASPADAALHRQLSHTAGAARTMFEQALQEVVDAEGMAVGDGPAR